MNKFLATLLASFAIVAQADNITGAGASFPYPVYAKWAEAYKAETGNSVNYQSIGSSGGIKQIDKKDCGLWRKRCCSQARRIRQDGTDTVPNGNGRCSRSCQLARC